MDNFNQASNRDKALVSSEGVPKNVLIINDADFSAGYPEEYYSRIKYKQWFGTETVNNNRSNVWFIPWKDVVEFNEGTNTFEFRAVDSGNLTIYSIILVIDESDIRDTEYYDYFTFTKTNSLDTEEGSGWVCRDIARPEYEP